MNYNNFKKYLNSKCKKEVKKEVIIKRMIFLMKKYIKK